MISGIGIPPEYLSYSEQTEFARSLAMMNGKFVRSVIMYQKEFANKFTKMFRILYKNEFLSNLDLEEKKKLQKKINKKEIDKNKTEKENNANDVQTDNALLKDTVFDLNSITIRFPSPQSLNMTAMKEQIDSTNEIIEFISRTLVSEDDAERSASFKRLLTQDLLSSFDWNKYNELLKISDIDSMEEKLNKADGENSSGGY